MPENTTTQALLIDHQGDRCLINRYDDRLYVGVAQDKLGGAWIAGPFTADELRAAIDKVAPLPGDPVDHLEALAAMTRSRDALGKSAEKAQADLEYRTRQRDAARNRAGRLQRELDAERERSQELLDRARAVEKDREDNVKARDEMVNRLYATLTGRTSERDGARRERDALQKALDAEQARSTELREAWGRRGTTERTRPAEAPQPRTEEDVTDREVEVLMKLTGTWQEGKRSGQQSALASKRARTIIVALSNLPIQEREEVDAIREWLAQHPVGVSAMAAATLASTLHARGFTAPGGES